MSSEHPEPTIQEELPWYRPENKRQKDTGLFLICNVSILSMALPAFQVGSLRLN